MTWPSSLLPPLTLWCSSETTDKWTKNLLFFFPPLQTLLNTEERSGSFLAWRGVGRIDDIDEGDEGVQTRSYKINKSWS